MISLFKLLVAICVLLALVRFDAKNFRFILLDNLFYFL